MRISDWSSDVCSSDLMRSTISGDGRLTLSIEEVSIDDPREDEIVVRVEATPINPTDLALLLGPADVTSVIMSDSSEPELTFTIPQARMATVEGRLGLSLPIGLEGAGTVRSEEHTSELQSLMRISYA